MYKLVKGLFLGLIFSTSIVYAASEAIPDPFAQMKGGNQNAAQGQTPTLNATQPAPIVIPEPPTFEAQSWVLMDYFSGRIITEHNSNERIWPASLTKMMTSYVIGMELKAGRLHMDDDVVITEDAWSIAIPQRCSSKSVRPLRLAISLRVSSFNQVMMPVWPWPFT